MSKKLIYLCLIVGLFPTISFSQLGQTGAIKGTVTFEDGGPLPGVSVVLSSPALVIGKMITSTNEVGQYRFLNLPPGKYELTFEMEGMISVVRKDIVVSANVTVTVDVQLKPTKIEESIVVTGQAPTLDRQSVSKTTTMDKELIESLPVVRSFMTFFNMTPGVSEGSAQGAGVRDNSFNLDGIQINDPVVGTSPGNIFSLDIMEEVSVQTSGVSAEFGSVKGGVLNIVTKSGGNRFSGSANAYYNHEKWRADNTKGTPLEGKTSGPKFEMEPGINFGGPIIKDKLWFFLNASTYRSKSYVAGFPYDKPSETPIENNILFPYLKLTFQPNQDNKFVLGFDHSFNYLDNRGASKYATEDTTWEQKYPVYVVSVIWTHIFSKNLYANLKLGASRTELNLYDKKKVGYIEESSNWLQSGSYGWDDLNPRTRLQMNVDATLFLDDFAGNHEMKFGIQGNFLEGRRKVIPYGPRDSLGMSRLFTYIWEGVPYYACWGAGHDRIDRGLNAGIFFNDSWNPTKRLTVNIGLRFDYNRNFFPAGKGGIGDVPIKGSYAHIGYPELAYNLEIEKTIKAFEWKNISPRLGLVYDLTGDGKTLIKTSFGRYLQDNYTTISFEIHPINWLWYEAYTDEHGNPTWITYTYVPGVDIKVGYKDNKLKAPQTYEYTLGLERELFEDWVSSLRFVIRRERDLIETVDATTVDMDALMEKGELIFSNNWKKVEVVDPFDGRSVTFYQLVRYVPREEYMVNPPDLKRDHKGFEVSLKKRFSKGWSLDLSYVFHSTKGMLGTSFWQTEGRTSLYDNPNAHVNAYGHVDLERKHQFKLSGVVKGPFGINLSGYFRYLSGVPYTRTVNSKDLGLPFSETVFAEPRGSRRLPSLAILDLRLEKELKAGEGIGFKVFGDVFNVLNGNKATGVVTRSSSPKLKFGEMTSIQDPRVIRLGAKVDFNF